MTWLVIVAVGAGSYVMRVAPLLWLDRARLGPAGERLIRHGGLAMLAALIALFVRHSATGSAALPTLAGLAIGTAFAVRQTTMVRVVVSGGAAYAAVAATAALIGH